MKISQLIDSNKFQLINKGEDIEKDISSVYCCDLLSMVMGKAQKDCAWITVMANLNTLAVSLLVDAACIILAEGMAFDKPAIEKAASEGITVFYSDMPIFESALAVAQMIDE